MSMVTFSVSGDYKKTRQFLQKSQKMDFKSILAKYGQMGVDALREATPKDSGETAESWGYEIQTMRNGATIYWTNSHVNQGVNIALILQYGHGTGTGGWVEGRDYINPSIQPIFDEIADAAIKEVEK